MTRRDGAKSKSRGEKLAAGAKIVIEGSQDMNNDETTSPLRSKNSRWKAHPIERVPEVHQRRQRVRI